MYNSYEAGGPSMCCVRWSNEAATVHADITADHRDVPALCIELLNKLFYSGCLGTFRQFDILIFQKSPLRMSRSQPACDDR